VQFWSCNTTEQDPQKAASLEVHKNRITALNQSRFTDPIRRFESHRSCRSGATASTAFQYRVRDAATRQSDSLSFVRSRKTTSI